MKSLLRTDWLVSQGEGEGGFRAPFALSDCAVSVPADVSAGSGTGTSDVRRGRVKRILITLSDGQYQREAKRLAAEALDKREV
jgi:hypothetical protein